MDGRKEGKKERNRKTRRMLSTHCYVTPCFAHQLSPVLSTMPDTAQIISRYLLNERITK
jgi:hypothetical protein